eukprot:3027423-Amphidinium_carterae.1
MEHFKVPNPLVVTRKAFDVNRMEFFVLVVLAGHHRVSLGDFRVVSPNLWESTEPGVQTSDVVEFKRASASCLLWSKNQRS